MRLASLTSSVSILVLLGAAGLVAFSDRSTAGEQELRQQTGAGVPEEALTKMQEAMEQLKKMQESGQMPGGIPTLPGKAKPKDLSNPTSSRSQKKKKTPPPKIAGIPYSIKPLLKPNVEYAATSYMETPAVGPILLTIRQSPNMARFEAPGDLPGEPIYIYRYDKGLIWAVKMEDREYYPGIKLYEEFALKDGTGMRAHINEIMLAYAALKYPEKLKNVGRETINGIVTTHYQKREASALPNKFNTLDYWLSDSGILMKVTNTVPASYSGAGYVIEMKDIKLGKQPKHLFVPPPGYEKALR